MAIKIDLGLRKYALQDADGGELGTISFNPSDPGLLPRFEDAKNVILGVTEKAGSMDSVAAIAELDRQVKQALDNAFGSPVSAVVFQGVSSLAICPDGTLVVEHVLEELLPVIEDAMRQAGKASGERVAQHSGKYLAAPAAGLAPGQA